MVDGEVVMFEEINTQIEFAKDRQPWEKQPQETDAAFEMFCAWRDLDPHERTYRKALKNYEGSNCPDTYAYAISATANRYRWRDRVNAYDRHVDEKIREQLEARRMRARLETADLGRQMRNKAHEAVNALKAIVMVEDNGKLVPRSSLSPSDITKLAKVGRELESYALEDQTPGAGLSLGIQINIGDSELRKRAREVLDMQEDVEEMTRQVIDLPSNASANTNANANAKRADGSQRRRDVPQGAVPTRAAQGGGSKGRDGGSR